jgi:L-threonylcarbamoyladenylate synthase
MKTKVLPVKSTRPQPAVLAEAAAVLRRGGLVAFPTETVYGLGANALDAEAVERIYAAKDRPARNPIIVHVADARAAEDITLAWPELASRLAARFWPGPLTLVLPKHPKVPDIVTAGLPTVGVRVPVHPVALGFLRAVGTPVAAPSANRSSGLSPTRAAHVLSDLAGRVDVILDGGPTHAGLESTVLDLTTTPPRLLRPGPIAPAVIEAVIGPINRTPPSGEATAGALPSPGLLERHYAPRTPLELAANAVTARERVEAMARAGQRVGWLSLGPAPEPPAPESVRVQSLPDAADKYAAGLYAALHELDAQGLDRLIVTLPPHSEAWLAVHDRLRRAARPRA